MFGDGGDVYSSLMLGLDLCEMGEALLVQRKYDEARQVLEEAWQHVAPCIDVADYCGYGKRCDRYVSRIRSALAQCDLQAGRDGGGASAVVSKEAVDELRSMLPNDGLNPDAHINLAQALISTMDKAWWSCLDNRTDPKYCEAHYHASVACALTRANKFDGRGLYPPAVVPPIVKKLFKELGDEGGWKRVIFCTGGNLGCSWLEADAASSALKSAAPGEVTTLLRKKATFVLLRGDYHLSIALERAEIDLYGINDQHKRPCIAPAQGADFFLKADAESRVRFSNLSVKAPSKQVLIRVEGQSKATAMQSSLGGGSIDIIGTGTQVDLCAVYSGRDIEHAVRVTGGAGCRVQRSGLCVAVAGAASPAPNPSEDPAPVPAELCSLLPAGGPIPAERMSQKVWRDAFAAALRGFVAAGATLQALGMPALQKRGWLWTCASSAELEQALCPEDGADGRVVVLTTAGLKVEKVVNVPWALLLNLSGPEPVGCSLLAKAASGELGLPGLVGSSNAGETARLDVAGDCLQLSLPRTGAAPRDVTLFTSGVDIDVTVEAPMLQHLLFQAM